jgi:hypothetical protein
MRMTDTLTYTEQTAKEQSCGKMMSNYSETDHYIRPHLPQGDSSYSKELSA